MDSEVTEGSGIHTRARVQAHTTYSCTFITASLHAVKEQEKAHAICYICYISFHF